MTDTVEAIEAKATQTIMGHEAQVLADHLRTILPEQDAADVAKWAANVKQVRRLIEWNVRSFTRSQEARACPECDESMVAGRLHRRDCLIASDLRVLYPHFAEMEIEDAHEEAMQEQARRFPVRAVNGANPGDLIEVRLEPGAWSMEGVIQRAPYRLAFESEQAAARARGPGRTSTIRALNVHGAEVIIPWPPRIPDDHTLEPGRRVAAAGWSLPFLVPNAIVRSRRVSDSRDMEAVESEARLQNAAKRLAAPIYAAATALFPR